MSRRISRRRRHAKAARPRSLRVLAALLGRAAGSAPGTEADAPAPWHITFRLPADTLALGGRPELRAGRAARPGRDGGSARWSTEVPTLDRIDPLRLYLGWEAWIDPAPRPRTTSAAPSCSTRTGWSWRSRRPGGASQAAPEWNLPPPADARLRRPPGRTCRAARAAALMRVPAERLDEMMDRVGELVIAEARLVGTCRPLRRPGADRGGRGHPAPDHGDARHDHVDPHDPHRRHHRPLPPAGPRPVRRVWASRMAFSGRGRGDRAGQDGDRAAGRPADAHHPQRRRSRSGRRRDAVAPAASREAGKIRLAPAIPGPRC